MSLEENFQKAAEDVKNLKGKPSDEDLLEIYGYYKQATIGDCNTDKPGFFDMKGKAKWEAWNKLKGSSQDDSKEKYIAKVKSLIESLGLN
ncbi:hypothetical protein HCN44_001506 [Aphidius gifuensis]|uniref:ACB domain-containing protein n=1 Tax=Aphidius gifuensis TaxID=684658 RepID=A0A834XU02_APHGI|nr:acyl-CoA-binding protein [Aphidius gifuensis]KAF7992181.1 hypothetical protein HCN44_001506 [Aphidius gifuensis]